MIEIARKTAKLHAITYALFALSLLCCAWPRLVAADPVLPHLLSDHMVLQQGREISIWGTADPREKISVSLAGKTSAVEADSAGHWAAHFAPMPAGGPFTLKVVGKKTVVIKDVMIGEVWIASGQSNMTFALSASAGATEEIPKAVYPNLRLFTVPKRDALVSQPDTLPAEWQPCTPEAVKEFSAVAYYFARDLHRKLNVPIGIIESAWPGTVIEEWVAPEVVERDPQIKPVLDEWNRSQGNAFAPGRTRFDLEFDDFELLPDPSGPGKSLKLADFDDGRASTALGGDWSYDWNAAPETTFDLISPGRDGKGFALHIGGQIDASDDSRLTAKLHLDGSPADLSAYAGIRFWVRGNGSFRFHFLQPTITDWDDYSAELLHASADWAPVTIWFRELRQEGWGVVADFTPSAIIGFSIENAPATGFPHRPASGLYLGMIAPLLRFPFRGAIWYQGESNALQARQYRVLLPDLIQSWRAGSQQKDMQFLIVQLPNHGAIPDQPSESAWAELREAQLFTAKQTPGAGLAVTIDVGDPQDVHPHRKAEVGERLALWALGTTYKRPIIFSGPMYDSMALEEKKIRIRFKYTGSSLEAKGGPLKGFSIAGSDRKFHWASAVIDGDSVIVSSPEVEAPVAVRYAWADSPECNLYNAEGLPASPFRTDDWPGITK